jgi:hypothetical protein
MKKNEEQSDDPPEEGDRAQEPTEQVAGQSLLPWSVF